MSEDFKFLGHSAGYWIELEKKAEILDVADFIQEIADLRGKVNFYESRIRQMCLVMKKSE